MQVPLVTVIDGPGDIIEGDIASFTWYVDASPMTIRTTTVYYGMTSDPGFSSRKRHLIRRNIPGRSRTFYGRDVWRATAVVGKYTDQHAGYIFLPGVCPHRREALLEQ